MSFIGFLNDNESGTGFIVIISRSIVLIQQLNTINLRRNKDSHLLYAFNHCSTWEEVIILHCFPAQQYLDGFRFQIVIKEIVLYIY